MSLIKSYGFLFGIYDAINVVDYKNFSDIRNRCGGLVVGILNDDLVFRITNEKPQCTYEERKELLLSLDVVDDVIAINQEDFEFNIIVKKLYKTYFVYPLQYMVGSQYGIQYENDKLLAEKLGISIVFAKNNERLCLKHLKLILDNEFINYDIVLFGTGKYFEAYMKEYGSVYPPKYAIDNDSTRWNTKKNGVVIKSPEVLERDNNKHLLVIICARKYLSMQEQLKKYGSINYRNVTTDNAYAFMDEWQILLETEKKHVKHAQEILKKTLFEFDRVCKKYNLKYYLSCGSVIGAVRHNGFIPWDDDVDIAMYQRDFDILKSHAKEVWPEGNDYKLVCPGDIGKGVFLDFLNRLMYMADSVENNSFYKALGKADKYVEDKMCLDIYVMNNAAPNDRKQLVHSNMLRLIYGLGMGHRAFVNYETYKKYDGFTRFVVRVSSVVGRFVPLRLIIWMHEKLARKYDKKETKCWFESNGYSMYKRYDKNIFGDGKRVKFDEKEVLVPELTEQYLEIHNYHNYMQYPPANVRKPTHGVKSPDLV